MANIQAKDAAEATIYLYSTRANTDQNPAVSQENLLDALTSLIGLFPASLGQTNMAGSLSVTVASNQSAVPVSGPLTNTELRATPVPVSGTVTANAGTGTFAVSGPLTDAQLRTTPVPVSGTVSTGLSQPLTDTQLRATAVPVSGTVSTGLSQPLTDTQLRATAVPVSGAVTANAGTGTFAVEPLGIPGVARQLAATNSSGNTALTSTCRRISITALVDAIRFSIGSSSQTASSTSHFIAAGERLDFAVPSTPNIAVIRAGSVNATLELTEYL